MSLFCLKPSNGFSLHLVQNLKTKQKLSYKPMYEWLGPQRPLKSIPILYSPSTRDCPHYFLTNTSFLCFNMPYQLTLESYLLIFFFAGISFQFIFSCLASHFHEYISFSARFLGCFLIIYSEMTTPSCNITTLCAILHIDLMPIWYVNVYLPIVSFFSAWTISISLPYS